MTIDQNYPKLPAMNNHFSILYKLGDTAEEVNINTVEENKNAALALAEQARHSIDIFSQDMDAEIYNNDDFEQAVITLAKKHPNTKIRILTRDSRIAVQNGHRLIRLAQHLTSSVFINKPVDEYSDEQTEFLIADKIGLLYRTSASHRNYQASLNFMTPQRAAKLTEFFNKAWEHSTADIQTRRVYV